MPGQLTKIKHPDGNDSTIQYDAANGNLLSVTAVGGFVTSYADYDAHGRARTITGPDGVVSKLDYSPRGWVNSSEVGGMVTRYEYDATGMVKRVTTPSGTTNSVAYDTAHRVTDLYDHQGNRIHYTLDAAGKP